MLPAWVTSSQRVPLYHNWTAALQTDVYLRCTIHRNDIFSSNVCYVRSLKKLSQERKFPQVLKSCKYYRTGEDVFWRKLNFGVVSTSSV
ncbi:hypothetical protein TNCT_564061 [Trichonephila clavata]|uniref:Uncharacterized protein n=1 Tax=Trichonephila clavata TaxID=2740835 RepID=A0A8X6J9V0_TRICU|nr:hypothetical protein TNCT_564061 [Trichonephila clavata]